MYIQTKYSWYRDDDVIDLAEQSSDELTRELAKRLTDFDPDDLATHRGCFGQDDLDDKVEEREHEIRRSLRSAKADLINILGDSDHKSKVLEIIDSAIEEI